MSTLTPSRQVLRHLSNLCRSIETAAPASRSNSRRTVRTHTKLRNTRRQTKLSIALPLTSTRCLTTTPQRKVQPNETQDSDPQNAATPILPDITNYYTLFPSTIPNGPPGTTSKTQSPPLPSTSTSSTEDTPTFFIHTPTLRKEFLRLQSTHHPDKYATGSVAHQKALALSSLINSAYKTLSDPLLRAQYLLQLQYDIDVTSEDNAAHPTDQDTLMEVMEAQERTESATTQDEVDLLKDENRERIARAEREVGEAFEAGDVERAKDEAVRLKYWRSLQGALDEWEEGKEVRLIH